LASDHIERTGYFQRYAKKRMTRQDRDMLNNTYYQAGDELYEQGEYKKALNKFEKALSFWPDDSDTAWAIGDCYSELGKPDLAEKYYRLALENCEDKNKYDLIYNIGNALFDQMEYGEAITYYESIPPKLSVSKQAGNNAKVARRIINMKKHTD
jgi:tetratricopeptide (TPR) repeat protein